MIVSFALTLMANYYITTFVIWFAHWFSHLGKSPLAPFHVLGHHLFYPDSKNILSAQFIYGRGKQSSIYSLLPWLVLQSLIQFLLLPSQYYLTCLAGEILIVVVTNQLHTEFHLIGSRLERSSWFLKARARHAIHHDRDVNYMVGDHFWDRVFGTRDSRTPTSSRTDGHNASHSQRAWV
jgi:sterol desaturase/sphingolipid hydroxylase (fatty acid hydroxylase superfamily)